KEGVTLRLILSHQAGLPAVRRPLPPGALYDWDGFVGILADEAPFWEPGTRQGDHAVTFGHLVGAGGARGSGKPLARVFRDEVSGPLGLDLHLGLPEADEDRVAATVRPDPLPAGATPWRFLARLNEDPHGVQALIVRNTGRRPGEHESREAHAAVLPSQGGI